MVVAAGRAEKVVSGRSIDNLKSAAMNIKVRLAIEVANAERHVRETLDEDRMLISLQRLATHRLDLLQREATPPLVK